MYRGFRNTAHSRSAHTGRKEAFFWLRFAAVFVLATAVGWGVFCLHRRPYVADSPKPFVVWRSGGGGHDLACLTCLGLTEDRLPETTSYDDTSDVSAARDF